MLTKLFKRLLGVKYTETEKNSADYYFEKSSNVLRIYFQWSAETEDWMNNFDFTPVNRFNPKELWVICLQYIRYLWLLIKSIFTKSDLPSGSYKDMVNKWFCHRGFLRVWKTLEPLLKDAIMDPEIFYIEIAGYSHGAAVAVLCHEYCVYNRPECVVKGYGFGCPRVIWGLLPLEVKDRWKNFTVIRNAKDLVTHVPPVFFGFRHVGTVIKVGDESVGCIKDHFDSAYIKALEKYEGIAPAEEETKTD